MSEPGPQLAAADPDSMPFFSGLERGELLLQRCQECQCFQFPPRPFCHRCSGTTLRWVHATGQGTVYSLTVCHRAATPEMQARVPFTVILVDLVEGVRILALLEGDPEDASIGMAVSAVYRKEDDRVRLGFTPLERSHGD